jgi:phosphohistidine swiveling domain-containing protein
VIAPGLILRDEVDKIHLKGKIIIIEGADPGFDWIFSQKIAGLITKYGGANSHMAIRCAEFSIPAAIGCGEQRFDLLLKSNQVHLDCAAGLINSLH